MASTEPGLFHRASPARAAPSGYGLRAPDRALHARSFAFQRRLPVPPALPNPPDAEPASKTPEPSNRKKEKRRSQRCKWRLVNRSHELYPVEKEPITSSSCCQYREIWGLFQGLFFWFPGPFYRVSAPGEAPLLPPLPCFLKREPLHLGFTLSAVERPPFCWPWATSPSLPPLPCPVE